MKTKDIIQRLSLFLFVLVLAIPAWAQGSNDISIGSKADWQAFCNRVNNGETGLNAIMTADVDLGTDIVMLGTDKSYSGTFDGQGYTLSFNWTNTGERTAPFKYVNGATIKNLRTQGKIASNNFALSGLIYCVAGTTTVSGCVSDVDLMCNNPYVTNQLGGMLSYRYYGSVVTFTDCVVKGNITAMTDKGKKGMGGFINNDWALNTTMTLNNCLYLGTNNAGDESYTFAPADATINNCYYLNTCGEAQGTQVTEAQLKSGEITKRLQGDRTNACYWAQQLGEMPDLYSEGDKSKTNYVYYDTPNAKWVCEDFVLTDGTPLPIGIDFTAATVTNTRTLAADKATLCLPYELPISGFKAYILSNTQGNAGAVRFKKVNNRLEAYKPYLLTANGTPQLGGNDIEVKAFDNQPTETIASGYVFKSAINGVDNSTAAAANAYILQDDGKFHKVTTANSAATIPAYRAYIICPPQASGAKQLSVVLDGETTGIGNVMNEATDGKNGPVYDLQGRRVADRLDAAARNSLPAGVYIVGGRKVVVK